MGLLNKIKNALFEEEEIEIPVEDTQVEPQKEDKKEPIKKRSVYEEPVQKEQPVVQDHELFKAEKTFDFPIFDDQEFNDMKTMEDFFPEEPKKNMSINLFDHERPQTKKNRVRPKAEEIKGRAYETKASDYDKRKFKPSPVISPVYGVLDKNYKKEDIVVIKQEEKKSYDVAEARKKAFGTLEEKIVNDLEDIPEKKEHSFVKNEAQDEKSIDELLEETAFDTIELPNTREDKDFEAVYDEDEAPITLDVLDKNSEKTEAQNETLENDLFELIDSMYENREDE